MYNFGFKAITNYAFKLHFIILFDNLRNLGYPKDL
jgi:hypothetical protein